MNRTMKRALALALVLVLALSLCAGTVFAASANNGVRGKLCTELSAAAKSYYGTGYDYETLSKMSGTELEAKLRTRMADGYQGNTYDQLKSWFKYTDSYNGNTSRMNCFYSGSSITSSQMNREHVWPRSLGNFQYEENSAGADVLHLKPTDAKANSARSNLPFGEVTGGAYQNAYTSSGALSGYYSAAWFEPLDSVKGDVARTILYVYTRWEQRNINQVFQSTDLLLKWCELDPVDEYEMVRNDVCQQYVNSRNVFVDYPEYCWRVFGKTIPTHMKTPSGKGNTCNNPDYTVTVTTPPSCTQNGVETHTCKNCGYSYTEVLPASGHHYVNGVCTVCGKPQAATQYTFAASIANGDRVVIMSAPNKKLLTTTAAPYTNNNTGVTYQQLASAAATVEGQELSFTDKAVGVFTVVKSGSNYAFKLDDGRFLTCENAQNLTLSTTPKSGTNYWTLEATANNSWYVKNTTTYYETYQKNYQYLEFYANKFTTYGMQGGGAAFEMTFYTETSNVCEHDYQVTATSAATCTGQGYTSYKCSKCGDAYTVYTEALGHDYAVTTVAPTATEKGYDLHVCSRCGDSFKDNFTEPLDPLADITDVPQDAWYRGAVEYAVGNGLMNGTSKTTFEPLTTMSRAMLVQVLYNLEGKPDVGEYAMSAPSFSDVKAGDWFANAVIWASYHGVVSGYDTGKFGVNDPVTREQIASILYRYAGYKKVAVDGRADLSAFPDQNRISGWAKDAVAWAVDAGFISGKQNGGQTLLDPLGNGSRAEVASMLQRFCENVMKAEE